MTKRGKSKPPSRTKYEREHPVTSFRTDKELRSRLKVAKQKEGKSTADILRIGVGILEVKARSEEEIRQEAYDEGQINGYEFAESEFKITYPCSACGGEMEVDTDWEKDAIRRFIKEQRWGHRKCLERRGWL
jgi:hypothetical protein